LQHTPGFIHSSELNCTLSRVTCRQPLRQQFTNTQN